MASTSRSARAQTRIQLAPKAGFCIKTTTLAPGVLPPSPLSSPNSTDQNSNINATKPTQKTQTTLLEPPSAPRPVPQGTKVFVNIAWDANVPPPPEGSEEAVKRAMRGVGAEQEVNQDQEGLEVGEWYVPVIVSPAREDTDKAGKPSLVFDCIYNSGVKVRTLRDPEFKVFLVELALQRIEVQTNLALSRAVSAPNIASKGKLSPRSVLIPTALLLGDSRTHVQEGSVDHPAAAAVDIVDTSGKLGKGKQGPGCAPLIEEISPSTASAKSSPTSATSTTLPGLKGILKKSPTSASTSVSAASHVADVDADVDEGAPLEWDWKVMEKDSQSSTRLRIIVRVPGATPSLIQHATLDVGPRMLALHIPRRMPLELDLSLSDAELVARMGNAYAVAGANANSNAPTAGPGVSRTRKQGNASEERDQRRQAAVDRTLRLKRQRDFDFEGAEAEWRLGSGEVVVHV